MEQNNKYHRTVKEIEDEFQIILLVQSDPDKFELLYNKYYKSIFTFVYNRTSNPDLSSDLCSQIFLKALINIKSYKFKGVPFSAWLLRIATNETNNYFRKTKQTRTINIDESGLSFLSESVEIENKDEVMDKLLDEVGKLPDKSVQLIEMRFFENRSFKEIGDILGISENNAKVKVHRIIGKLKDKASHILRRLVSFFILVTP